MKFATGVKIACLLSAIGFTAAASATNYTLTQSSSGQATLDAGDIGYIPPTEETGTAPFMSDWFFQLGMPASVGGDVASIDLTISPGNNFSITGLSAVLVNTGTNMSYGSGSSFALSNLPAGNYEVEVSGTPTGTLGGIFSGAVAVSAVPLPSAVWLLLSGVVGVAALTRRREPKASRSGQVSLGVGQ